MNRVLFASLFAVAAVPMPLYPQAGRVYDVQLHAGVDIQLAQLGVRESVGGFASVEATRRLSLGFAVGPSVSVAAFPAPDRFVSPAGCFGASPCIGPEPSAVKIASLGAVGTYSVTSADDVTPFILAGFGLRYLTESPERDSDMRPYIEAGAGTILFRKIVLRARYQRTQPGPELPKWAVPISLGIAF